MADPLDALKKAQSIGPDPTPPGHPEDDWLGTAVQGLLGAVGLGDPTSQANRGGQLVSAGIPLLAPHPAISALLKSLSGAPEAIDPLASLANEKVGGWTPHRSVISAPPGFSFGDTSAFPGRDQGLVDRFTQEQGRFTSPLPTRPTLMNATPTFVGKPADAPSDFDSKFNWKAMMRNGLGS